MKDIISDAILAAMICNHKTFFLASPLHIVSHDYHGQRLDTDSSQHYKRLDTDGAGVIGHSLRVSGLDLPDDDDGSRVDDFNYDDKGVHHNNKMDERKHENSTPPVIPPPVILEEPLNMSDTIPWLLPGHLQRLLKTSSTSPPSLATHNEDNATICGMASAAMRSNRSPNACPKHPQDIILKKHLNLRSQLQTQTCETVKWLSQYHYMTSELVRWIIKSSQTIVEKYGSFHRNVLFDPRNKKVSDYMKEGKFGPYVL